ncbi:NRDE protein-domain-containing protein [Phyllosticta capitalensis]|uniref:NRDE protein-domain-containing protein n=1 Tax=Phyllosticta capitalensis TaxID=121624 RepID=A0ABR1Z3I1_9PEZI
MCIAIVTTAHPDYPFILLNNRDEYLRRPTAPAQWWAPPHDHVLGGYDLHRPVHGTWLGITRQGRLACLTNFREEGVVICEEKSRGAIPNAWLKLAPNSTESTADFAQRLVDEEQVKGVGGFSLLYGRLQDVVSKHDDNDGHHANGVSSNGVKDRKGLAILSNRTPDVHGLIWVAGSPGETHALSNSHYGDNSWPKIVRGEEATAAAVAASVAAGETRDQLLERLFGVLSTDSLPKHQHGESWEVYLRQLRNSIFIPDIGREGDGTVAKPTDEISFSKNGNETADANVPTSGIYGTQRQSLVLVDRDGRVTFVERSLFDAEGRPIGRGKGDQKFEFQIEDW